MRTTAQEIQAACHVGLILVGTEKDGGPQWMGTKAQFEEMWVMID